MAPKLGEKMALGAHAHASHMEQLTAHNLCMSTIPILYLIFFVPVPILLEKGFLNHGDMTTTLVVASTARTYRSHGGNFIVSLGLFFYVVSNNFNSI